MSATGSQHWSKTFAALRASLTVSLIAAALAGTAIAGPFVDADRAYATGDYATALRLSRQLANEGSAAAQFNLGVLYERGKGVPQDYSEAFKWYKKAADQGNASAQHTLGVLYDEGQGVTQDYVESYKRLDLAASRFPPSEKSPREGAVSNRDLLARKMTSAQIAEAQNRAREWKPTK